MLDRHLGVTFDKPLQAIGDQQRMVAREEILHTCCRVLVPLVRSQFLLDEFIQLFQCYGLFRLLAPIVQKLADLLVGELLVRVRDVDESQGDIGLEELDVYVKLEIHGLNGLHRQRVGRQLACPRENRRDILVIPAQERVDRFRLGISQPRMVKGDTNFRGFYLRRRWSGTCADGGYCHRAY